MVVIVIFLALVMLGILIFLGYLQTFVSSNAHTIDTMEHFIQEQNQERTKKN